jgi:hypothetical protein
MFFEFYILHYPVTWVSGRLCHLVLTFGFFFSKRATESPIDILKRVLKMAF